jgi:hypothetical protein
VCSYGLHKRNGSLYRIKTTAAGNGTSLGCTATGSGKDNQSADASLQTPGGDQALRTGIVQGIAHRHAHVLLSIHRFLTTRQSRVDVEKAGKDCGPIFPRSRTLDALKAGPLGTTRSLPLELLPSGLSGQRFCAWCASCWYCRVRAKSSARPRRRQAQPLVFVSVSCPRKT